VPCSDNASPDSARTAPALLAEELQVETWIPAPVVPSTSSPSASLAEGLAPLVPPVDDEGCSVILRFHLLSL
jgi:hypothetical protein